MSLTLVYPSGGQSDDATYVAHNSLRPLQECQRTRTILPVDPSSRVKCTYLTIEQQPRRQSIILTGPWWAWGGEMGINERGVVIVTEPVLTRDFDPQPGLIGMDLVRLGLEQAESARDGVEIIADLIMAHGQGGAAGSPLAPGGHDNNFIIADGDGAWLLETAGRNWVARKVHELTILAPWLTIDARYDLNATALTEYAHRKGWSSQQGHIHFSRAFHRRFPKGTKSEGRRRNSALRMAGFIDRKSIVSDLMSLLRHTDARLGRNNRRQDISVYSAQGGNPHVTNSMVSRLSPRRQDHFITGTAAPQLSIFKPFNFDNPLGRDDSSGDMERYNETSLWWRHERFTRRLTILRDLEADFYTERNDLERNMTLDLLAHRGGALMEIRAMLQEQLLSWAQSWYDRVLSRPLPKYSLRSASRFWRRQSACDGVPL